ncbi:MAG TPA: hypothetical protein VFC69_03390 [Dysgonamonadaceae bacterium]|nr:hypothetical protein [Dysgonamonadaceae bacterium]
MTPSDHQYFQEIEIEHNHCTYYANGCVEYIITQCVGGSYEGYDYELLYEREIHHIAISKLWYYHHDTGDGVDILGVNEYNHIERVVEELIREKFE